MKTNLTHFAVIALFAAGAVAGAAATENVRAGDLATSSDRNAMGFNVFDQKLAISLAAETHVQIELARFAIAGVHDEQLKQLAKNKLHLYRELLTTLDYTSNGRIKTILERVRAHVNQDNEANLFATTLGELAKNNEKSAAVPAKLLPERDGPVLPPNTKPKAGRVGSALQDVTIAAILRVRLEVAEEYKGLLVAELSSLPSTEFDRKYVAIEIYNQMQVLSMLRVFERQASVEFGRAIHKAADAAEEYAGQVKEIAERLNKAKDLEAARRLVKADGAAGQ